MTRAFLLVSHSALTPQMRSFIFEVSQCLCDIQRSGISSHEPYPLVCPRFSSTDNQTMQNSPLSFEQRARESQYTDNDITFQSQIPNNHSLRYDIPYHVWTFYQRKRPPNTHHTLTAAPHSPRRRASMAQFPKLGPQKGIH